MISTRPKMRQLVLHFTEAMMARVLQNVASRCIPFAVYPEGTLRNGSSYQPD